MLGTFLECKNSLKGRLLWCRCASPACYEQLYAHDPVRPFPLATIARSTINHKLMPAPATSVTALICNVHSHGRRYLDLCWLVFYLLIWQASVGHDRNYRPLDVRYLDVSAQLHRASGTDLGSCTNSLWGPMRVVCGS